MRDISSDFDDISLSELKNIIQTLAMDLDNEPNIMALTGAIGVYIEEKLQNKTTRYPVFPIDLIPIPDFLLKQWGQKYASIVVKKEGKLLRYQEDGALYYTRFRSISNEQWELIKADAVENLFLYNMEVKEKGLSNLPILPEFKQIIDDYQRDYKNGVVELHDYLRTLKPNKGCLFTAMVLILIVVFSFIYI